jgi:pyruvate formate-lyase/glycerol dehydratase family glycyl radical enzyme
LLSPTEKQLNDNNRVLRLKKAVQSAQPGICTERAVIWTGYFKQPANRKKHVHIQIAEALQAVLIDKSIKIYADELIVGNFSSKRVGGSIFPELHGVAVLADICKFAKRETNPLAVSRKEILRLIGVVPFWLFRFLAMRVKLPLWQKMALIRDQLTNKFSIINESGGISHLAPNYEKLLAIGTDGIKGEVTGHQQKTPKGSEQWYFYEAVKIIVEALARFGERYAFLAEELATSETDPARRSELNNIASVCRRVPRKGATTLQEALQSLFFAQIAINLESLDNAVCPGRMDQYLYPYYRRDLADPQFSQEKAKELIGAFSVKMSEIIPVFSGQLTNFHGGMFNGQVVTVGGMHPEGDDATNELSYIFLEVMNELRMRQPNYHARIHSDSPRQYIDKIISILARGSNSPALYHDDVIIETMCKHGYRIEDARDYTGVGCVEPVSQGRSFSSTDAAIFNVPLMLELALNEGRRFGLLFRCGAKTKPVSQMQSMAEVREAFETQLAFGIKRLIKYLQAVEIANRDCHPTPLTSALLAGCLESGKCSTAGGALYNFSGIQCVAPADTGDALYAIEQAVFVEKKITLGKLVGLLKQNLKDEWWRTYLRNLAKFGNDEEQVDRWAIYVVNEFNKTLARHTSTRGGKYVTGLYSVTAHQYFGEIVGALPSGRRTGESFSSGVSPGNGMDRKGPTALINSVNRYDFSQIGNGINFNLQLDSQSLRGETGRKALESMLKTYLRRGGMQVQLNVLDPELLIRARANPDLYPNLLVRVSGYSAYFNDLTPKMKDELISRTFIKLS